MKHFDEWNEIKKGLDTGFREKLFSEREIWLANTGVNVGIEQDGGHNSFMRPVLILRKYNQKHFIALPLTSRKKDYPHGMELPDISFLMKKSWVIVSQIRAMSHKRLYRKLGSLPNPIFEEVIKKSAQMLFWASGA